MLEIPMYIIVLVCIAIGVVGIIVLLVKIVVRQEARKNCKEERQAKEERAQLEEILPKPWLQVYDKCKSAAGNNRLFWFQHWIKNVKQQHTVMPILPLQAIEKFACMVAGSCYCDNFRNTMEALSSYCDFDLPLNKGE